MRGAGETGPDPVVLARPRMRGWSHLVSFPLMVACGTLLVVVPRIGPRGRLALAIYAAGTAVMFGASAVYHRVKWRTRGLGVAQRVDHSAIYLAIAGGYTPVAWAALDGWWRAGVLAGVWGGAVVGMALPWLPRVPRGIASGSYIAIGWVAVVVLPAIAEAVGMLAFVLIVAGGVAYTVGAICFATRRPDPWPRVFGYHEVFHACTVVAASLQFAGITVGVVPLL